MQYFTVAPDGPRASRIILGCWPFGGGRTWGSQAEDDSIKTIHAASDAGINSLDTALGYGDGESQRVVGKAIAGRRSDFVIFDKIPRDQAAPRQVQAAAETALRNLGTDYIDVFQLHWANSDVPLSETVEAAEKLRAAGKIRHFAVCNFGPEQLDELLGLTDVPTNQLAYSLLSRAIEFEIQPKCVKNKIGILAYSPLMQGLLTGKYASAEQVPAGRARTRLFSGDREFARHGEPGCEEAAFAAVAGIRAACERAGTAMADAALSWVLARDGVAAAICGARTPEQIESNVRAAELSLDSAFIEELDRATEPVKQALGRNADLWNADSRIR